MSYVLKLNQTFIAQYDVVDRGGGAMFTSSTSDLSLSSKELKLAIKCHNKIKVGFVHTWTLFKSYKHIKFKSFNFT